ncbi:B3/B4 domain-containing protein (DNA/RNA-binding domain of Phe-tRNA-synthetase) [Thermomonospora echinospora]|uniref:B3/B4 domain-containing protein (DNA/RNA-binding domain of Phe-tRNA-synthetase) n=1 Tax=Thermomonospora echinospora TaxID=1992 RepID=A0A1H6DC30_9ACTN|nr:phenylalanine--tRNA ligase beta subunit-related protein [Thermomonospora echinospora]SEG82789.1 B3/B4 domain-containing protein (DNA/RNA-binding domain of Phe-tRNA-synthetase) [Thermomonospora echinospora]
MLAEIWVEDAVQKLRPDFAVLAMTAEGLANDASDDVSADWLHKAGLRAAEAAQARSAQGSADDPHVLAWREAYRGFGAKPQRTRPSVDALLRRVDQLPAINRVVDAYNAVSVEYALPIGGEDLDTYQGTARLVRARGDEGFETTAGGAPAIEHPDAGEVVWRDDQGVTCRRWNWRQCVRTRITETTENALFLLERLEPYPLERLHAAADDLAARLRTIAPEVRIRTRLIGDGTW